MFQYHHKIHIYLYQNQISVVSSPDGYTPFKILKCISFAFGFMGNFKYLEQKEYIVSLEKICLMEKDSKGCDVIKHLSNCFIWNFNTLKVTASN